MGAPRLIYCASGNPAFAAAAVAAGWSYGARLPGHVSQPLYLADQDWRRPDRDAYLAAVARHRPAVASVLDWERPEQLPEVLDWALEAAALVSEAVILVPKVPGRVGDLPRQVGGRRVVLGYSVPTSYGAAPLGLWELAGWPVHLLGGSPHRQREVWHYLRGIAEVISLDGNVIGWHARRGRCWQRARGKTTHWWQLRDLGDNRPRGVPLECFRRSLEAVRDWWHG